jgi:hypothetical protein
VKSLCPHKEVLVVAVVAVHQGIKFRHMQAQVVAEMAAHKPHMI